MGLDMYLYRKTYVQNWNHTPANHRHDITIKRGGVTREDIKPERISYIVEKVAYWRKANAIHKWFVENVQGGKDDCREYPVERDQLQSLVDLCKRVLATVETVEGDVSLGTSYYPDGRVIEHTKPGAVVAQQGFSQSLLPTQSGFFFGGTDYDEYYLDKIRETIDQIDPVLAEDSDGEFTYDSSW